MRPSRQFDAEHPRTESPERGEASEMSGIYRACPVNSQSPPGAVSSPMPGSGPVCDRIDSQASGLGLWLDRLIEQGDPDDSVSMVHRQQAWLELLRGRMVRD